MKRGLLVQLLNNVSYEDIPIGAVGEVLEWNESQSLPSRGGLYTVSFPTEDLISPGVRTMFADRFKIVGKVQHG